MPQTRLLFYMETDGSVPVKVWLEDLQTRNRVAFAKCVARIQRLADCGHNLRRPHADILRDRIYELRVRHGRINYRILYFFHGRNIAVLAHGLTKEGKLPAADIDRAIRRMRALELTPSRHIYEETDDGEGEEDQ